MLEKTCPKCGRHLICRDGKYGEFLGCTGYPFCDYTERGADEERIYQPPSPYCEKCNHTGLIPFVKNGEVIPNAFLHCDCHPIYGLNPEPEHYRKVKPEDFDFPMSSNNYRSLCHQHGWQDPGPNYPAELPEIKAEQPDLIKELEDKVASLESKLTKYFEKKKRTQQKGIEA